MSLARAIFALAVAATLTACGGSSGGGGSHAGNDGILWLSWTIKGAPPSDSACSGIDHLELTMNTAAGPISIEPIPCLRGLGWEYDNLPEGDAYVIIDALNARGFVTLEGGGSTTLATTKPAMPTPIDLVAR